jgi:hypothetical protein
MATITGTIKVNVSHGEFAGVYTGDFSYDDTHLTKVGEESMNINGENANLPGSFNFRFLDFATGLTAVTYTARDIDEFPDHPVLLFEKGIPTKFGLQVFSASIYQGFGFLDPKLFRFGLRNGIGGEGLVTLETNEPTPVLENFSPFTSLLAFFGLGAAHLWSLWASELDFPTIFLA